MNKEPFYWLNENSRNFLKRDYLKPGVTAEERILEIAKNAEKILKIDGFADKFSKYMALGYYSLSTPVWCNFGNSRGLPVSCFGSYIPDTTEGILRKAAEVGMMTKMGGGTSGFFGQVRPSGSPISVGGKSFGPVPFMEIFDRVTSVVSQGSARRGSFAAYLPVEHPDVENFLQIRSEGHAIQEMSFGVTITDAWMRSLIEGDSVKRKIWSSIIRKRYESGYPYIMFSDNVNDNAPAHYREQNLKIHASNLCSEIALPSNENESFVCVLSSINLLHWDEILQTDAVETMIYFLDAVNEEFVDKSEHIPMLDAANYFAKTHRALGMGVLGWHSYLQSKEIPFESLHAKLLNTAIFKELQARANQATADLAGLFGSPSLLQGYGIRNATTLAIAPTTSSAFILGQVSQSIEPINANIGLEQNAKGRFSQSNPAFLSLLDKKGKNTELVRNSVLENGGSVQHLDFLSDDEKDLFKTFSEISQRDIIIQAANRQKYIDQSQSLNLSIAPNIPAKDVSKLMIEAWEMGVKSLYYQRSASPVQEGLRNISTCRSCEG